MAKFLLFLSYNIAERPHSFGLYHFCCIIIVAIISGVVCIKFKDLNEKQNRIFLLICWAILIIFEIYKEVVFAFNYTDGVVSWHYPWYAFPFQFCSNPFFILPLAIFVKNKFIKESAESFLSFYGLLAGVLVFVYPESVYETTILGVLIQTMVHHGIMIVLGVYFIVKNRKRLNIKFFLKGIIVFTVLVMIAFALDEIIPLYIDDVFNMFFISRKYGSSIIVLDSIFASAPYIVFLLIYVLSFSLGAFLMFGLGKLFTIRKRKINENTITEKE